MKQILSKSIFFCSLFLASHTTINAQVTIGNDESPAIGSLLQLKEDNNIADGSKNSTKGLLMPRVELLNTKLDATFTDLSKTIRNASGTWDKDKHIGLWVYNVSEDLSKDICPGLYTWNGTNWVKLGKQCTGNLTLTLNPATGPLYFNSGLIGSTVNPQDITAIWEPNPQAKLSLNNSANGSYSALKFVGNPLPTNLTSGNQAITIKPDPMSNSDISSNLFRTFESKITFTASLNGKTIDESIIVNQTNKALTVDNETSSLFFLVSSNATKSHTVKSNASWSTSISPTTGAAISNLLINGLNKNNGGTELYNNTAQSDQISYNITTGASKSRYSYLTFFDTSTPKRFGDIVITITQCAGDKDLSMIEYRDLWEKMYGLNSNLEPNSNGNETKNINKVQWHTDQDGNIFFSAMFGDQRWMTTNLAAKKYASNVVNPPTLNQTYTNINPGIATYGYPNGIESNYTNRPRMGLLYNWYAATGNQNNSSTSNQQNDATIRVQGICPTGWHLPNYVEADKFLNEITNNYTKYSSATSPVSMSSMNSTIIKDACEAATINAGTGKSNNILEGGFSLLLAGNYYNGVGIPNPTIGDIGAVWTSATGSISTGAYYIYIGNLFSYVNNVSSSKAGGNSVRCVKD